MKPIHAFFWAIALAGIVASQVAFAKTPASQPAARSSPSSSEPSATERVETWTREQWNAARKEWAKDKAKWASCRKKSKDQRLSGRKSWSFLYGCMTG